MPANALPVAALALPDSVTNRLRAAVDAGESAWREVARITEHCLEAAADAPRMAVYQAVSYEAGAALSTIRLYHQMEMRYGDLLDEYPMVRLTHLRIATKIANEGNTDVASVIIDRLKDSDEWGGRMIPPDVWQARLNGMKAKPDPYLAALDRAERNLSTALRHAPADSRATLARLIAQIADVGKIKT